MKLFIPICFFAVIAVYTGKAQENALEVTDEELLELYSDLRVADVSDGMDMAGLRDVGLMDPEIEALWKDIDNFSHRFCGIAVTRTIERRPPNF